MNSSGRTLSPATSHPCRKPRNPPVFRRRRYGASTTPRLLWKFDDSHQQSAVSAVAGLRERGGGVEFSARTLAAELWRLRSAEDVPGCRGGLKCRSCRRRFGFEPVTCHVTPCHHSGRVCGAEAVDPVWSPLSTISSRKHGNQRKFKPSLQHPKYVMEGATKRDSRYLETCNNYFHGHTKLLEDKAITASVSALQADLLQGQLHINKVEAAWKSSKKKSNQLLRQLGEEKTSQQHREQQKLHAVMGDLKNGLSREREIRKRMETFSSKLVKELANVKLCVKQLMKNYEEEKSTRELMEEVCNKLAVKIREDNAEFEAFKRESMKFVEQVEEEKKMLQMAEVWREERVQMKLVDAKLALEDKYSQMNKLITDLKTFLRSRSANLDVMELRKAELISHAVNLVDIQDIKEFDYVPLKSEDMFSILEEIQQYEANETGTEPCNNYSPANIIAVNGYTTSPDASDFNKCSLLDNSNGFLGCTSDIEDDFRGWKVASLDEDQCLSNSLEENDLHVNKVSQGIISLSSRTENNKNADQDSPKADISQVCLLSSEQSKPIESIVSKSSMMPDETRGWPLYGTISILGMTPKGKPSDDGLMHRDIVSHRGSQESVNPHITRAMKGWIEWPQGIKKNGLKARKGAQKTQLNSGLKKMR